jgi:hypothetical protein
VGLIRKTLFVTTAGAVRPSSKKQRVAKATLKAQKATMKSSAAAAASLAHLEQLQESRSAPADVSAAQADANAAVMAGGFKALEKRRAAEEAKREAQAAQEEAARQARAAQIAEAARLKRERNQRRRNSVKEALRRALPSRRS